MRALFQALNWQHPFSFYAALYLDFQTMSDSLASSCPASLPLATLALSDAALPAALEPAEKNALRLESKSILHITDLPDDLVLAVASFLTASELLLARGVSVGWAHSLDVRQLSQRLPRLSFKDLEALARVAERLVEPEFFLRLETLDLAAYRPASGVGYASAPASPIRPATAAVAVGSGTASPVGSLISVDASERPSVVIAATSGESATAAAAGAGGLLAVPRVRREPRELLATELAGGGGGSAGCGGSGRPPRSTGDGLSSAEPSPALPSPSLPHVLSARVPSPSASAAATTLTSSPPRAGAGSVPSSPSRRAVYANSATAQTSLAGPCQWVADLSWSVAACERLKRLTVGPLVPIATVGRLLARARSLRRLNLALLGTLTDAEVAGMSASELRDVDFTRCSKLTDAAVRALLAASPALERLLLRECPRVTDAALTALARAPCARRLATLSLSPSPGGIAARGISQLLAARARGELPSLRNLLLADARFARGADDWADILRAFWQHSRGHAGEEDAQAAGNNETHARVRAQPTQLPQLLVALVSPFGLTDTVATAVLDGAPAQERAAPATCVIILQLRGASPAVEALARALAAS